MRTALLPFAFAAAFAASTAFAVESPKNPLVDGPTWADLKGDIVGDTPIAEGSGVIDVDAPFRAFDAATVPVHVTQRPLAGKTISKLMLVIDENPAPVAATFTFGKGMGPIDMETRVRVNQYSNLRAIAFTDDGKAYMDGRFVRASGGCSAPAIKDPAVAMTSLGQMKLRQVEQAEAPKQSPVRRVAQVMVRHPNYSGLQRDQITHLFIGARFINELEVYQGDDLLFKMEGGISISEDPSFRFTYTDNGADTMRVHAVDTDGATFDRSFPINRPS